MNTLYEWQRECLEFIKDTNAIVSAPTSAGKTRVAYLWMDVSGARDGKHKIIYTVPIKALANEKTDELIELYGKDLVGIETGDIKVREKAPILVCTQEIYTRKYARKRMPVKLIIDEFHYIFGAEDRARAYVEGIAKAVKSHQILIMSATLGNPQKVRDYLLRTTGKEFVLYETDFRPTKLTFTDKAFTVQEIPPYSLVYVMNKTSINRLAKYLTTVLPPLPLLKRRRIKLLAEEYKVSLEKFPEVLHGIAKYHAGLTYTEKRWIEKLVREGFIHTCLATSALGVGVNLPFQWVLFGGVQVPNGGNFMSLSKTEFLQLAGRAGRKGYFDEGFVGYLKHGFSPYEDISESYKEYKNLIQKPLEEPRIVLRIDIEALVKGLRSPEEELSYVLRFSEPPPDEEKLRKEIELVEKELSKLEKQELKFLKRFYLPDLGLHGNVKLTKAVLKEPVKEYTDTDGKTYRVILLDEKKLEFIRWLQEEEVKGLLLLRKVLKTFDGKTFEKFRIKCEGLAEVEARIKALDPLLLEVGR